MKSIGELCDLSGQVAIVTGAGRGIGYAIANRLSEAGAAVVINDVAAEYAAQALERLHRPGRRLASVAADVSRRSDVQRMLDTALDRFGRVDILINNAGIYPYYDFFQMTLDQWEMVMAVNSRGVFLCSQVVAQHMISQNNGGKIVNLCSVSALRAMPDQLTAYAASKATVITQTQYLAKSLAQHRIRVNAIAPGGVDTEGARGLERTAGVPKVPLGRRGEPDDVARAALFLACDMAAYITGIILTVDGGWLLA